MVTHANVYIPDGESAALKTLEGDPDPLPAGKMLAADERVVTIEVTSDRELSLIHI